MSAVVQAEPDLLAAAQRWASAARDIGPSPEPCLCGQPFWRHTGPAWDGPAEDCPGYRLDPAWQLAQDALEAGSRDAMADVADHNRDSRAHRARAGWRISPSDAGRCPRAIWYRNRPPADYLPLPEDTRAADAGTAMHAGITAARSARYPWRRYALLVAIPGLDQDGEIDEYDPVTGIVEDWKTAGDYTWEYVQEHGPYQHAWEQALIYAFALAQAGHLVKTVQIRYINRKTGWELPPFTREYSARAAQQAVGRLIRVAQMLDTDLVPPREGQGPTSDPQCQRCPAREHCWQMEAAAEAGRTPESYVAFGPDPQASDPAVIWAVEQAGLLRERRLALEKKEDAAKALAGLPPGKYGQWEVVRTSTRRADWHKAYDRLLGRLDFWWEMSPPDRPPLTQLAGQAPKSRSWSYMIRRVRAEPAKGGKRGKRGKPAAD